MHFSIRPVREADRETFLTMSREFYGSDAVLHPIPEAYHTATFEELIGSERYLKCLFFEAEGAAVGYALLNFTFNHEAGGRVTWVEELYVRPAFQGRGCARQFFAWLEEHFPAARYRLEVEPENERAMALYRRVGFKPLPYAQMIRDRDEAAE